MCMRYSQSNVVYMLLKPTPGRNLLSTEPGLVLD